MILTVHGSDPLLWVPDYDPEYIAIVGTRRRNDQADLEQVLLYVHSRAVLAESVGRKIVIVSGGAASGADHHAEIVASAMELDLVRYRPRFVEHGAPYYQFVRALFDRNARIVELASTVAAQIHHDRDGGTEDAIKKAHKLCRPVELLNADGTIVPELAQRNKQRKKQQ